MIHKELKKGMDWLVWSSENPQIVSKTIKGLLVMGVSQINSLATDLGVTLPYNIEKVIAVISQVVFLIGFGLLIYGLIMKVSKSLDDLRNKNCEEDKTEEEGPQ